MTGPPVEPRGVGRALTLALAVNLVTLLGVVLRWWPAGNVFLLFWVENLVLGLATLVRISTSASPTRERVGTALFFSLHYGIFCVVHLVFTLLVATAVGLRPTWLLLGLPAVLLLVRFGAEVSTTWFGDRGLRHRTPARAAMFQPYPRVVVLHVAVLLSFGLGMVGLVEAVSSPGGQGGLLARPAPLGLDGGVVAVAVLVAVKTVVDVVTTRRALRPR